MVLDLSPTLSRKVAARASALGLSPALVVEDAVRWFLTVEDITHTRLMSVGPEPPPSDISEAIRRLLRESGPQTPLELEAAMTKRWGWALAKGSVVSRAHALEKGGTLRRVSRGLYAVA